jgi:hypothetical protein
MTIDEEANRKALDEAAGVAEVRRSSLAPPPVTRPANAQPLVKTDTREKLLYKIASSGTPIGNEFFDLFPDVQEILTLALNIAVRQLSIAMCNPDLAATQRIASMRTIIALNGKQLPGDDDEQSARPAPPLAMPTGATQDVEASLKKIRELSGAA